MEIEVKGKYSMAQLNAITNYLYEHLTDIVIKGYAYACDCKFTYKKDKMIIETWC